MTAATTAVLYACGAALLYAFRPSFAKFAGKRVAPSLMAALYATLIFAIYLGSSIFGKTARSVLSVDNLTFVKLLGAGALRGIIWLCLFAALSTGQVNRVFPLYLLSDTLITVISVIIGKSHADIWKLCCILLILLGVVMAESRSTRSKASRWLWFALMALIATVGLSHYRDKFLPDTANGIIRLGEAGFAALFLWILSAAGKSFSSFKKMDAENWLFIVLCGLSGAMLMFFETQVTKYASDITVLNPIRATLLPLTVLLSRLIHQEKMPANAVLGVALFTAGTFGIMLGL